MSVQHFTSEEKLNNSLPYGYKQIHVPSLTDRVELKGKYLKVNVYKRYPLKAGRTCSSIKLVLREDNGSIISFHGFGDVATHLDSCYLGDTLFLLAFEVELAPKQDRYSTKFQIIADEESRVKPIVWILKRNISFQSSGSEASSSMDKTVDQRKSYLYTPLIDLKIHAKVNVYGVITHVREVSQTRNHEKFLLMNITDQSMPSRDSVLTCNLFNSDVEKLPTQAQNGDVIRFHRLKIQRYENKLQATNGPGFHWLLFQGSFDNATSSAPNYTVEAQDKEKIQALFEWSRSYFSSDGNDSTILDDLGQSTSEDDLSFSTFSSSTAISGPSSSTPIESRTPQKSSNSPSYQLLRDVKSGTEADVYGIMIYVRPLMRTKLLQYHLMMNITDQSLRNKDDKLTCNLFHRDKDKLPFQAEVGDVIRLKQVKIQVYQGKKQGNGTVNWALFRGSCKQPIASSDDFIPNSHEMSIVSDLWKWWHKGPDSISFSQCSARQYFNVVCLVIGVYLEADKSCRVVRVCDGTAFNGTTLKRTDAEMNNEMDKDEELEKLAGNMATDLFFFDNHADDSYGIEPGDFIKVTNLHANVVTGVVEMTLHGGTKYNKGVTKLEINDPEVQELLEVLKPFLTQSDSSPSAHGKGKGKRRRDESSDAESTHSTKKYCKRRTEEGRSFKGRSYEDSQNVNNSKDAELALAKEYDNIPDGTDLSQCDRLVVEAYLNKNKTTVVEGSSSKQGNTEQINDTQSTKSTVPGSHVSSNLANRVELVQEVRVESEKANKVPDRESTSESSGEASPSIWLSLYNSPTSNDEREEAVTNKSDQDKDQPLESSLPSRNLRSKSQLLTKADAESSSLKSSKADPGSLSLKLSKGDTESLSLKSSKPDAGSRNEAPKKPKQTSHSPVDSGMRTRSKGSPRERTPERTPKNKRTESVSSQDTYVTAPESLSPEIDFHSGNKQHSQISSTWGFTTTTTQLSLRQSKSHQKVLTSSQPRESEDVISSSLESQTKSKGVEQVHGDSQVSSSTESKNSELSPDSIEDDSVDDVPLECFLQTVTVVLNHPNIKRSKLSEVYHHKVPHKFKILGRMVDYHPKPVSARNLVAFCCLDCHHMSRASVASQHDSPSSERLCPNCTENGTQLQPVIIMKFILSDGKHDILCHLWKSHAVDFFRGIEPQDLLSNNDYVKEVQECLDKICPPDTEFQDKPFVECCIFSYKVKGNVNYQMFDTAVV